jgi:preprotein translocase subunit SecA
VVEPLLIEAVKLFAGPPPPPPEAAIEEKVLWRDRSLAADVGALTQLATKPLEQQIYVAFGCRTDLSKYATAPAEALEMLRKEVPMSLTEQRERLLDLTDDIISTMVDHACPANKHVEDWDFEGLSRGYHEQLGVAATGIEKIGDAQAMAHKLYDDAHAILEKREREVGQLLYLRVFRNFYLQEIDNQWLEHLQAMDNLRDGIGLRGYGQRDPKKEYQKEGFELFLQLIQSCKAAVVHKMFHFVIEREDEVERLEAQRRQRAEAQQEKLRMTHPGAAAGGPVDARDKAADGAPLSLAPGVTKPVTVKRDKPKVGRNDPCWCGSGKKYKQCHLRSDDAGADVP